MNGENPLLLGYTRIIDVVRRSLSKIDPRLIDHGERVGYIASCIYEQTPDRAEFDFSRLFILCVLHDIGAYKTEEIDNMVLFETNKPFDHSVFGYLFLKNTTHLREYAKALLNHHTSHGVLINNPDFCNRYAEMIHLADRADILLSTQSGDLSVLKTMAGKDFDPVYVDALFKAEEKTCFSEKVRSGSYNNEIQRIISILDVEESEIMDYLKLLVYAIDFRSPYTVTHTADTTVISLETGKLLGLGEEELHSLYIGAFLHDIGKIAIPHEILEKPERLTPEEFTVVKRHIPEGEEILRGVISDEICDIALRHHEKLDGSGYPLGITGEQITLPQRIVAVSDIMSALSQRRSYKAPYPKDKVINILTDMKNEGHICPLVVDTVCTNYDLILRKTEKSHDPVKTLYSSLLDEYKNIQLERQSAPL